MGEIIESRRRHYVGDDADKDSIPAGGKSFGDSYHANDKGKQYYWNGTNWKTGLGYEYVTRRADGNEYIQTGLVTDGTWKVDGLDFSGIVPAGAVAVRLRLSLLDDAANSWFLIRPNADNTESNDGFLTQVANTEVQGQIVIPIDADRLVDYSGANLAFTTIKVKVLGWFI